MLDDHSQSKQSLAGRSWQCNISLSLVYLNLTLQHGNLRLALKLDCRAKCMQQCDEKTQHE